MYTHSNEVLTEHECARTVKEQPALGFARGWSSPEWLLQSNEPEELRLLLHVADFRCVSACECVYMCIYSGKPVAFKWSSARTVRPELDSFLFSGFHLQEPRVDVWQPFYLVVNQCRCMQHKGGWESYFVDGCAREYTCVCVNMRECVCQGCTWSEIGPLNLTFQQRFA